MPELPDLEYIVKKLKAELQGRIISGAELVDPIVVRMLFRGSFASVLSGCRIDSVSRRGPFIHCELSSCDLIMHLMLAGRLQCAKPSEKPIAHRCFSISFGEDLVMHYGDEKRMGKIYLVPKGEYGGIPGFLTQGVDILSPEFTLDRFLSFAKKCRKQARVFIMDQSQLSAVGNAYADEILFHAKIHPKTTVSDLDDRERERLYTSITEIMNWGIEEVSKAAQPIEVKVRDHMRVRNRKDSPCPVCGATIRRANVLGYDSFFCPSCQKPKREQFIDWSELSRT
jgi:formamidopyrimidine-DNA glycosylase